MTQITYGVFMNGGSIGRSNGSDPVRVFDTKELAQASAQRMNKARTPGERKYYGIRFTVKIVGERA